MKNVVIKNEDNTVLMLVDRHVINKFIDALNNECKSIEEHTGNERTGFEIARVKLQIKDVDGIQVAEIV